MPTRSRTARRPRTNWVASGPSSSWTAFAKDRRRDERQVEGNTPPAARSRLPGRLELGPGPGRRVQVVDRVAVLAGRLCGVHRSIGLGDQLLGCRVSAGPEGDPDRTADDDRPPAD